LYHGRKEFKPRSLKQGLFRGALFWVVDHPHEADAHDADADHLNTSSCRSISDQTAIIFQAPVRLRLIAAPSRYPSPLHFPCAGVCESKSKSRIQRSLTVASASAILP
jgi:hypothetical protein